MKNQKIKSIFILIVMFVIFFMMNISMFAETNAELPENFYEYNSGSAENPFMISNLGNLRWLSETEEFWGNDDNQYFFIQTADIDATETKLWNFGSGFSPIGHASITTPPIIVERNDFRGNFNGNNFLISNLYINENSELFVGFFGGIYLADISFLRIENAEIRGYAFIGGIVGQSRESSIRNSSFSGKIYSNNPLDASIAGLIGISDNTIIEFCYSTAILDGNNAATISGLVSVLMRGSLINSYFNGDFVNGSNNHITTTSGLVMMAISTVIENCYVSTTSKQNPNFFGLVGAFQLSVIKNTFWDIETTGLEEPIGIIQGEEWCIVENINGLLSYQMKIQNTFIEFGWDFESIWDIDPENNDGYPFLRTYEPITSTNDFVINPSFMLIGNYPNPFNPETIIKYSIDNPGYVSIDIYNIRGQKVRNLLNSFMDRGEYYLMWNGRDDDGFEVGSAVYFYMMRSGEQVTVRRMVLLK